MVASASNSDTFGSPLNAHVAIKSTTQESTFSNALQVKTKNVTTWIVDLRESDYMTRNAL